VYSLFEMTLGGNLQMMSGAFYARNTKMLVEVGRQFQSRPNVQREVVMVALEGSPR
jgi:hypothetical protein